MKNLLRLSFVLALSFSSAYAVDWKALKPQGYVSDFAGVIDAQSKAELENYATRVEQQTGAEMSFVVIQSLNNEPIEDVANTIYRAWGVGKKGKEEGILLLLSVGDRRDRLEIGYGLEPILPDALSGDVLRAMRPALRQGQYGESLRAAASTIGSRIAQAKGITLDTSLPSRIRRDAPQSIPWPIIIGGIVLLLLLTRGGSGGGFGGMLPGLILGNMMGRRGGWGGGSGGGFGGYDSGGGFGGFGGGDSGGGGASSDW